MHGIIILCIISSGVPYSINPTLQAWPRAQSEANTVDHISPLLQSKQLLYVLIFNLTSIPISLYSSAIDYNFSNAIILFV